MTENEPQQNNTEPRVYFAAERTLLAWVRTGLALMGFGFVVSRLGLFLREISSMRASPPASVVGSSLWIGTALVLLGVVVHLCAAASHWRTLRRLDQGQPLQFGLFSLGPVVTLLLELLGVVMVVYLLFGFHNSP